MFDELKLFLGSERAHQVSHWSNWIVIPLGSASGHLYKALTTSPDQVRDLGERAAELALGIMESVLFLGYGVFALEVIIKATTSAPKQIEQSANKILKNAEEPKSPEPEPEKKVDPEVLKKEEPQPEPDSEKKGEVVVTEEKPKPNVEPEKKVDLVVPKKEESKKENLIPFDKKETSVIQPVKVEKLLSSEELEMVIDFFAEQFRVPTLHRFFILVVNNHGNNEKSAAFILDHYESYKKQTNPDFTLSDEDKKLLVSSLIKQMDQNVNKIEKGSRVKKINDHMSLQIDQTVADGSCAFHALLGTFKNGKWRCEDVQAKRKEFCVWLQDLHDNDQLPECINLLLHDYFNYPQTTPPSFKALVKDKYEEHKGNPDAFVKDPDVFKAYLKHLVKTSTYLDQTELEALALCFNKKIYLYQPGWFNDRDKVTCSEPINKDCNGPEVCIWYNGVNHYERAKSI